ncbi:hypothetical protein H4219_006378 [Mycoemilia scoparia]|uniref:Uncharacterized protein n=1 Tax=Mycoemilia scoparia TaxID=417184 RepID=A0A9W7ZPS3_9FUNG|nr:hypothetical protein H4219_006378 [Mycoemilia scoparia]
MSIATVLSEVYLDKWAILVESPDTVSANTINNILDCFNIVAAQKVKGKTITLRDSITKQTSTDRKTRINYNTTQNPQKELSSKLDRVITMVNKLSISNMPKVTKDTQAGKA